MIGIRLSRPALMKRWRVVYCGAQLFCNVILILWGITVVPATVFTLAGIGRILADLGLQGAIGLLALVGPLAFQCHRPVIAISFLFGILFAVSYDGAVLADYVGVSLNVNEWLLFIGAASLSGFIAGYKTRQFSQGLVAAVWALLIGTATWTVGVLLMHYAFLGEPPGLHLLDE
jgi:hypothetical protein